MAIIGNIPYFQTNPYYNLIQLSLNGLPWHAKVLSLKELHLAIAVEGMSPNILPLTERAGSF
jgi:hypothetical protein